LQACLLFHALDLLPAWGDELFTLKLVPHPVREIIPIAQQDVHAPLYYLLLHSWLKLPLPWKGISALPRPCPENVRNDLSARWRYIVLEGDAISDARRRLRLAATVWIARNTRDVSTDHITTQIQSEACAGRRELDTLAEPYAAWQQAAMRMAGISPAPTHFYQLMRCAPAASSR